MARPWQTYEEFQVDDAIQRAVAAPDEIRAWQPRALFPEKRGFAKQEAGVMDILYYNRYAASNNALLSGMPVRTTLVDDSWSGSGRYSMETLG